MQLAPQPHPMVLVILQCDLPCCLSLARGCRGGFGVTSCLGLTSDPVPLSLWLSGCLGQWGCRMRGWESIWGFPARPQKPNSDTQQHMWPQLCARRTQPYKAWPHSWHCLLPGDARLGEELCCRLWGVPVGTQPRHRAGGETWLGAEELSSTFWLHDPIEIPSWAAAPAVSVPEAAVGTQGGVSILAQASV